MVLDRDNRSVNPTPGLGEGRLGDPAPILGEARLAEPAPGLRAEQDTRSVGELFKDLRDDTTRLFQKEFQLAKTEMSEKAAKYGRNSAYIAAGGVAALLGAAFMLLALSNGIHSLLVTAGLSSGVAVWLAPLIVGLIVAGVAYALIQKGISTLKRESAVPEKTVESLKENKQWLQEKIS